jgi:hypothetical protein
MRALLPLYILLAVLFARPAFAQNNPYLDKKKKNRPSVVMARQNRKELKKQKRMARKQMRHSRRSIARSNRRKMKG